MTAPESDPRAGVAGIFGRVLAGLVSGMAGIVFLLCSWIALRSRFEVGAIDAHGYGLIFGVFLAIVAGFVTAGVVPLVFTRVRRRRLYAVTMTTFVVVVVALIALLVTA